MLFLCATGAWALPPAAADYGLVWSDEFNGTTVDTAAWSFDTGAGVNNEQEFYTKTNYTLDSGCIMLNARYNANGINNAPSADRAKYTSCRINSAGKKEFQYGYFEARMKAANGHGLWPAIWLLGSSINHGTGWPACGEMELYEARTGPQTETNPCSEPTVPNVAGDNCYISTCHYQQNGAASLHCGQRNYGKCLCDGFHTYAILWDSSHVEYYFDDTLFWGPNFPTGHGTPDINQSYNFSSFHQPFYWIMNVAVGGSYQGNVINNAIFPQKMDVDYVRVYQKGGTGIAVKDAQAHAARPFALLNPAAAQLKVYDLQGRLIADFSGKVRAMKAGDDALKAASFMTHGVFVAKLSDGGKVRSQMFVSAK